MKTYRNWLVIGIIVMSIPLGCTGLANYTADPYGIFRKDFTYQIMGPDDNFVKTKYITSHPEQYDCVVFGSSRVSRVDVRKIQNKGCYNMSYPAGLPGNHLDNLRYMLKKGMKIKLLIIGIDDFTWRGTPEDHLLDPARHPYPPAVNQRILPYYLQYLFSATNYEAMGRIGKRYLERLVHPVTGQPPYQIETGLILLPELDKQIEQNREKHVKDPKFRYPVLPYMGTQNMEGAVKDIRSIADLARTNGARFMVFINPIHRTTYLANDLEKFFQFQKSLAGITGFWDFSGLNSVTTDNFYYSETSHYRMVVGDLMIARMFGLHGISVPSDFGSFVTAANVDNHIKYLRKQLKEGLK